MTASSSGDFLVLSVPLKVSAVKMVCNWSAEQILFTSVIEFTNRSYSIDFDPKLHF